MLSSGQSWQAVKKGVPEYPKLRMHRKDLATREITRRNIMTSVTG
jgi:hypothetical protein